MSMHDSGSLATGDSVRQLAGIGVSYLEIE